MLFYPKLSKFVDACRNYSLLKLAGFLRHSVYKLIAESSVFRIHKFLHDGFLRGLVSYKLYRYCCLFYIQRIWQTLPPTSASISMHAFADDNHAVTRALRPQQCVVLCEHMEQCITAIGQWMTADRLKLNADKSWSGPAPVTVLTVYTTWTRPGLDARSGDCRCCWCSACACFSLYTERSTRQAHIGSQRQVLLPCSRANYDVNAVHLMLIAQRF